MLTELAMGAVDTGGPSSPIGVGALNVMAPDITETLLPHPSPHSVYEQHADGKIKFWFTVIHVSYVIYIFS